VSGTTRHPTVPGDYASLRSEAPQLFVLAAMWLAAALAWPAAPESVPVHWGLDGQVDRFGSRVEGVLLMPGLATVLYLLLLLIPLVDPRHRHYSTFRCAYAILRGGILAVLALVYAMVLLATFGVAVDVALVVPAAVGALLVILGLVMPRLRSNWFAGVRTPWTLTSERSWQATHDHARWVFVLGGIGIAASGVLRSSVLLAVAFGVFGLGTAWLVVYSYLVWRRDPDRGE